MNNPLQIIKMLISGGKNAKETVMEMTKNNNNPVIKNLIKMAEEGNTQGIENFARNIFKEQGRDLDKEMQDLQQFIGNIR